MIDWDVLIVGGGIAGASLAAEVADKRRTLIVEAEDQCGYHSTGRSAAFFLESYGGPLVSARHERDQWTVSLADGSEYSASVIVDSAGAWADSVAESCGVSRLGIVPKRRTMVQLRVGRSGLKELPLVNDSDGNFYFKGEGDRSIWLSPHDAIETEPCDAAPEEIDIATAIDRFEGVVDWPVEKIERSWAGLRSFAPDRLPVYGFDPRVPDFFWCA